MAFVDTMLDESDSDFVIVDRHHMPGGHWNDAYPFVRLHQPSAFYGVASTELGSNRIDRAGSNEGFYELASGAEVSAYFDRIMRERFLASGRVRYYPMCEHTGDGSFRSLLSPKRYSVSTRRKVVDGTFFNTSVPSTHQRKFAVDSAVACIAPNELPRRAPDHARFTILGGGKTAMDTGVWLLDAGADPDKITWIFPRDSWLINRETTQPGLAFGRKRGEGFAAQLDAMQHATSADDLFERFEASGVMLRIDPSVRPDMFHYATISRGEVDQLRRIRNVIRQCRVSRLDCDRVVMEDGSAADSTPDTLFIDCTATAVQFAGAKTVPIFSDEKITLQALMAPLVTTSAALIGFVEANFESDTIKNRLCRPVELADTPTEWMQSFLGNAMNQNAWAKEKSISQWLAQCRLDPNRQMPGDPEQPQPVQSAMKEAIGRAIGPALQNLQKLIANAA